MRIRDCNWMQVESYLQLPSLGAVPYLGPTSRRLLWKRDAQVPTGPEAAPSMGPPRTGEEDPT